MEGIILKQTEGSQPLPPKSCTIERLVTIDKDVDKVLAGRKTATRRNRRYADVELIMNLNGPTYTVNKVYSQSFGEMTDEDAEKERFDNLEAYKDSILSIHPGMKWASKMQVCVHEFEPVQDSAQ